MRMLMLGDARTQHLARWARHFRRRGDDVLVASAEGGEADVHFKLPVSWPALGYPMLVPLLKRLIGEWNPDLVVSHYLPNYGFMTVLSGFRPHVVVAWGSDLLVLPQRGPHQRARLRYVATRAQAFLVDAQMLVEPLVKLGAPVERVYVCPFGVDDDVFEVEPDERRHRDPLLSPSEGPYSPAEQIRVLSTRQLERRYSVEVLLNALQQCPTPLRAIIANDGSFRSELEKKANELGLESRVKFRGVLDRQAYVRALNKSHIYVSTSPSDSTSVSLLEAMAAGLACVVPDIPGNREWIKDRRNGLLYPPMDSAALAERLHSLASNRLLLDNLGERARQTILERGKWSHTIRRAELLFTELVNAEPCHGS